MGLFDKLTNLTGAEIAKGEFVLTHARYQGQQESAQYGSNHVANVTVHAIGDSSPQEFVCFGVLAQQISRMESGDLPAVVRIGLDGQAHVWELVRKPEAADLGRS